MLLHILYLVGITARSHDRGSGGRATPHGYIWRNYYCIATAIGGGSVRDILLGHYPLGWVKHRNM